MCKNGIVLVVVEEMHNGKFATYKEEVTNLIIPGEEIGTKIHFLLGSQKPQKFNDVILKVIFDIENVKDEATTINYFRNNLKKLNKGHQPIFLRKTRNILPVEGKNNCININNYYDVRYHRPTPVQGYPVEVESI